MPARIIDACCLINLYASGKPIEVIRAFGGDFFIPRQVRNEALMIRKRDEEDGTNYVSEPIDLSKALGAGDICECQVEERIENDYFVRYAMELDDGEAACMAIAKCRGWAIATDDRKAIRLAKSEEVGVVTTPELVYRWAKIAKPKDSEVAQALRNIELFARFRLGESAAHYRWWMQLVGRSQL